MPKGRYRSSKPRKYGSSTINKSSQIRKKIPEQHFVKRMKYSGSFSHPNSISTTHSRNDLDNCDYPCGICMKPVTDNDEAILCDSGNM